MAFICTDRLDPVSNLTRPAGRRWARVCRKMRLVVKGFGMRGGRIASLIKFFALIIAVGFTPILHARSQNQVEKPLDLLRNEASISLMAVKDKAQRMVHQMDIPSSQQVATVVELEESVLTLLTETIVDECTIESIFGSAAPVKRDLKFLREASGPIILCQIQLIQKMENEIRTRFNLLSDQ